MLKTIYSVYFKHTPYFGRLHMSEIFSSKTLTNRKTHIYTLYFIFCVMEYMNNCQYSCDNFDYPYKRSHPRE